MESDDEIELLKQPHSVESEGQHRRDHPQQVNPASVDDSSIDPASVHALQAAFTTLKNNYNEQTKKLQDLTQRHRLVMQRSNSGNSLDQKGMEPILGESQPVGAGAGASQDDETYNAEIRAKQGYIQHLERELLRSNNNLTKGNDEIERLKKQLLDTESQRLSLEQECERLHENVEMLSEALRQSQQQSSQTDQRTEQLSEALRSTTLQNERLSEQIAETKRHLENTDRVSFELQSKENEIQELTSRIKALESEKITSTNQYRDLEKCIKDKDREICALEAKHKQYVIENDINRKTVQAQIQRGSDSIDEIDGDRELQRELQRAVLLIHQHSEAMQELKNKVEQQKVMIQELTKLKSKQLDNLPRKDIEEREAAQGESFHFQMNDETARSPIYMNTSPRLKQSHSSSPNLIHKQISPNTSLVRGSSDRGDYRAIGSGTHTVSPRINDSVKPTGNTHVPRMIAAEQPLVGVPERNNVLDSHGYRLAGMSSPRGQGNAVYQSNVPGQPNVGDRNTSPRTALDPIRVLANDTTRQNVGEFNTSPRLLRQASPRSEETSVLNMPQSANFHNTRFRPQMANDIDQPNPGGSSNTTLMNSRRIPDRMTQSEIIFRDTSPRNRDNTPQQVVPHLDLTNVMSRSQENIYPQGQPSETAYLFPQSNRTQAGVHTGMLENKNEHPNYENVYDVNYERNTESPESQYNHSVYVNDPDVIMSGRTPVEHQARQPVQLEEHMNSVSALKICPVCNSEFSRLTMDQFQTHVFECFDNNEEPPATIHPGMENTQLEEDRTCPMCGATFPLTVPQESYEQHVLAHFGEEPLIERFEMLN